MFDYDKEAKHAVEVLDQYDFTDVLKKIRGEEIEEVICIILDSIPNHNEKEVIKYSFDCLSEAEAIMYLQIRYKIYCTERVAYYLNGSGVRGKMLTH